MICEDSGHVLLAMRPLTYPARTELFVDVAHLDSMNADTETNDKSLVLGAPVGDVRRTLEQIDPPGQLHASIRT